MPAIQSLNIDCDLPNVIWKSPREAGGSAIGSGFLMFYSAIQSPSSTKNRLSSVERHHGICCSLIEWPSVFVGWEGLRTSQME
jgi:hypothetical protein